MRQLLAQYGAAGAAGGQIPEMGGVVNDPMMALMQQMMGFPPMGAQGEAGVNTASPPQQQQGQVMGGEWWKLLHTLGAFLLAIFSLRVSGLDSGFDGSLEQREAGTKPNSVSVHEPRWKPFHGMHLHANGGQAGKSGI